MARGPPQSIIVSMDQSPLRVIIVGGGVAALETMIALRGMAQERVRLELVTPSADWTYRPLAVAEPFGFGAPQRYDLVQIARDHGTALHLAGVQTVEPAEHRIVTWDGRRLSYDVLVLAIGARPAVSLPGSLAIAAPGYAGRFKAVLRALDQGRVRRVAFAVPSAVSWPLPIYEVALMTARRASGRGLQNARLSIVTPEQQPLDLFGAQASSAVAALLEEHGVRFCGGRHPAEVRPGELVTVPFSSVPADSVVSLPLQRGPNLTGLAHDPHGFIPTDLHGRVQRQDDVYAAGDATTYPIKQGGIAAQQAAAVAEAVAARAGAPVEPRPFRPVLRGLLLTGEQPEFVRADVSGGPDRQPEASPEPLWWPPSKVATRWLAPYLALKHEELEAPPAGLPVEAEPTAYPARL